MRLTELFGSQDTTKTWEWTHFDDDTVEATFTVGDVPYRFVAYQDTDESPGDWEVEFVTKKLAPGVSPFGVTGTGRASEVFSTVVNIMREFINKKGKSIRRIAFAAKEGSRQDLYVRMVRRLLPDWIFEQKGPAFYLTRPGLTWLVSSVEQGYNTIPPVEIKANSKDKAKEQVLSNPKFNGADPKGIVVKAPPQR